MPYKKYDAGHGSIGGDLHLRCIVINRPCNLTYTLRYEQDKSGNDDYSHRPNSCVWSCIHNHGCICRHLLYFMVLRNSRALQLTETAGHMSQLDLWVFWVAMREERMYDVQEAQTCLDTSATRAKVHWCSDIQQAMQMFKNAFETFSYWFINFVNVSNWVCMRLTKAVLWIWTRSLK